MASKLTAYWRTSHSSTERIAEVPPDTSTTLSINQAGLPEEKSKQYTAVL